MDAWSQAMIDGIANYTGNRQVEARCHAATAGIDAAIDDMIPVVKKRPNTSILSVLLASGQNMESIRANIKLAIFRRAERAARCDCRRELGAADTSRAACAGTRRQSKMDRRVRGICALDRAYPDVAAAHRQAVELWRHRLRAGRPRVLHVRLGQSRRGLLCRARSFRHHPRYAKEHRLHSHGPHYCAGAFASRAMVADVALPSFCSRG